MEETLKVLLSQIESKESTGDCLSEYENGVKDTIVFVLYRGSLPIIE